MGPAGTKLLAAGRSEFSLRISVNIFISCLNESTLHSYDGVIVTECFCECTLFIYKAAILFPFDLKRAVTYEAYLKRNRIFGPWIIFVGIRSEDREANIFDKVSIISRALVSLGSCDISSSCHVSKSIECRALHVFGIVFKLMDLGRFEGGYNSALLSNTF